MAWAGPGPPLSSQGWGRAGPTGRGAVALQMSKKVVEQEKGLHVISWCRA